jgi:hypothetical protein
MATISVRIELPEDDYRILVSEQQKRRGDSGKKVSLNDLALEYFTAGLQAGLRGLNHDSEYDSATTESSTLQVRKKALELSEKEKQFEAKENKLKVRESDLRYSENELREREQKLIENYNEFYEKRDDFTDEREKSWEKLVDSGSQKVQLEFYKNSLNQKDVEIQDLKDEIKFLKISVLSALDKIDDKTDSNILRDWIIPILPSVLVIIGYFITNQSIKSIKDIKPLINDVKDFFADMPSEQKQKYTDMFFDMVNNNKSKKNTKRPGI